MVHGGASSARGTWALTAPSYANKFHIIGPDHRGHGETDWDPEARYSIPEYAADLAAFVDALSLAPFFLIAHSMGGLISMAYAADHAETVRALVLVDAGLRFGEQAAAPRPSPLLARPLKFDSRADAESFSVCSRSAGPSVSRADPKMACTVPISEPPAIAAASEPDGAVLLVRTSPPRICRRTSGA